MAMCTACAARLGGSAGHGTRLESERAGQRLDYSSLLVPEPIAEVPADVVGTRVTRTKVVTARAVKAIGRLHVRSARWICLGRWAVFNGRIIVQPGMTPGR